MNSAKILDAKGVQLSKQKRPSMNWKAARY
jgi:hypothetical protein